MSDRKTNQGEGNREAARRYNEATEEFVNSGQVEKADPKPANKKQAEALKKAERAGKKRAKATDPAVTRDDLD